MRHYLRTIFLTGILCALAGCDQEPFTEFRSTFGWNEAKMVGDGWIEPREQGENAVFCYQTIGEPDCYDYPLAEQAHRRVRDPKPPVE